MSGGGLARRYVRPLFDIAVEKGQLEAVRDDLRAIDGALIEHPELKAFLVNPSIDRSAKKRAVEQTFATASKWVLNFVKVLLEKNRAEVLFVAGRLFDEMLDKHEGVTPGVVETAVEIDDQTFRDITTRLEERFKRKLKLKRRVDPDLIGGVRVQVGNTVIDGSVRNRLTRLRSTIAGG